MSLAQASSPGRVSAGRSRSRRDGCGRGAVRRRRAFAAAFFLVLGAAAVVNYGPFQDWWTTREKLQTIEHRVAGLESEKAALQEQLSRSGDRAYLEALARRDISYVRPGEELFIIKDLKGVEDSALPGAAPPASDGMEVRESPGFVERLLSAISRMF